MKLKFKKYQHVERLGTAGVEGITDGLCYIFPKLDGTNSSVWYDCDKGCVCSGSRNRQLSEGADNAGFNSAITKDANIETFLSENQNVRLFGEWLVPHSLKTYEDTAWRKLYVFDVMVDGNYLPYDVYSTMLEESGIEYIKPMAVINEPSTDELMLLASGNSYLMQEGHIGEGVVIKRYDFINKYGEVKWAKIVNSEFRAANEAVFGPRATKALLEEKIANKYVTAALVEKEASKIMNAEGGWESKLIPRLLHMVYYSVLTEEIWNIARKHKKASINFSTLNYSCSKVAKVHLANFLQVGIEK